MSRRRSAPKDALAGDVSLAAAMRRLETAFGPDHANDRSPEAAPAPDPALAAMTVRAVEAMLFAAAEPLSAEAMAQRLPTGADVAAALAALGETYQGRGVRLRRTGAGWRFETAPDLAHLFIDDRPMPKKLPRAALETLAVIAYHQPATRAEIEEVRGVSLAKGTLDFLVEIGWVAPRGRRRSPGRPLAYATTPAFLSAYGLASLDDLPGKDDLLALGAIDAETAKALDAPRPAGAEDSGELFLADDGGEDFFVDHHEDP